MSEADNKQIARRLLEEVINGRSVEQLAELAAPDVSAEYGALRGLEAYRRHLETFLHVYPDLHATVDGQVAEGEIVVTWFTATGRHEGEWQGIKPTHGRLTLKGVNIQRIRDGRIVEHWGGSNSLEALLELGVVRWVNG
jgi:predicted ester cyclase